MDPSETYAEEILNRFASIIDQAAYQSVQRRVGGKFAQAKVSATDDETPTGIKDRSPYDWAVYRGQADSVELKEARHQGELIMLGYAGIRVEKHPHQFGLLAKTEEKFKGNTGKIRSCLRKSLRDDISQALARERKRIAKFEFKNHVESIHNYDADDNSADDVDGLAHDEPDPNDIDLGTQAIETTKGAPERKLSARFPLLWMREVEGYTNETIAEKRGVSLATIKRRIQLEKIQGAKDPGNTPTSLARGEDVSKDAPFTLGELQRCELQRNGLGPKRGHCRWCIRAIRDAAVTASDRWSHKYRDQGNCYCLIKRYVDMAMDYQEHHDSPAWFTSYLNYGDDAAVDIDAVLKAYWKLTDRTGTQYLEKE